MNVDTHDHRTPETIDSLLRLRLLLGPDAAVSVTVRFHYDPRRPYGIDALFHADGDTPIRWSFARELLAEGLTRPVGLGDIQIWPSRSHGRGVVFIALRSADGTALLEAPHGPLAAFAAEVEAAVPLGQEERFADLDAALAALLDRRPAGGPRYRPCSGGCGGERGVDGDRSAERPAD
ncbi:SsgA family sporulation/cell division regulator [Allostreptomyces psammosilenae]|uniref:Sporulation and cell division protein SsgA n=1 Tax=Allostreptomyces psammosilenae TaxID=1892865 RepID=A0A853A3Y4_9ACTN|nr:SsgA family sporulation/cell division regulator [Allostreptomyces psammosilenae]NYI08180.1 hypothetical protein [Allostreptomyces psammosilenae]